MSVPATLKKKKKSFGSLPGNALAAISIMLEIFVVVPCMGYTMSIHTYVCSGLVHVHRTLQSQMHVLKLSSMVLILQSSHFTVISIS